MKITVQLIDGTIAPIQGVDSIMFDFPNVIAQHPTHPIESIEIFIEKNDFSLPEEDDAKRFKDHWKTLGNVIGGLGLLQSLCKEDIPVTIKFEKDVQTAKNV